MRIRLSAHSVRIPTCVALARAEHQRGAPVVVCAVGVKALLQHLRRHSTASRRIHKTPVSVRLQLSKMCTCESNVLLNNTMRCDLLQLVMCY